jgi:hypothetical protein
MRVSLFCVITLASSVLLATPYLVSPTTDQRIEGPNKCLLDLNSGVARGLSARANVADGEAR